MSSSEIRKLVKAFEKMVKEDSLVKIASPHIERAANKFVKKLSMDSRYRARSRDKWYDSINESNMTASVTLYDDDGSEYQATFPIKYEVCDLCGGMGKHVNPSVDAHGISADEFYEDPDFAESYQSGLYDVQCYECNGKRVVPVIDEKQADPEDFEKFREQQEERAMYEREHEAEKRFGA